MFVVYMLWLRQLKRYLRSRARIVGALGQPLLFLVALGFVATQAASWSARAGRLISSRGSFGAPWTVNAGGRAAEAGFFFTAGFGFAATGFFFGAATVGLGTAAGVCLTACLTAPVSTIRVPV